MRPLPIDLARLGRRGDDRHLVVVLLGGAQRRLDQAQEDLGRVVVVPAAVGAEIVDDAVDAAGAGAAIVPVAGLRLPEVGLLPVDAVGDVDVAVHEQRRRRAAAAPLCAPRCRGRRRAPCRPASSKALRRRVTKFDFAMLSSRLRSILRHDPIRAILVALLFATQLLTAPASAQSERWMTLPPTPSLPAPTGERHGRGERRRRSGTRCTAAACRSCCCMAASPTRTTGATRCRRWRRSYQVIVIDSRGHGRSTRGAQPYGYELMASDVLGVMDKLAISRRPRSSAGATARSSASVAGDEPSRPRGAAVRLRRQLRSVGREGRRQEPGLHRVHRPRREGVPGAVADAQGLQAVRRGDQRHVGQAAQLDEGRSREDQGADLDRRRRPRRGDRCAATPS